MQISMAWRLIARVFLPFAAGYYLSYLFRTINALIAGRLISDTGLDTADLGLLTSVYFLVFAAAQIPIGILLDRFGPRRVQSALLLVAAAGAGLFAMSTGLPSLLISRAMIGLGVAAALTAGLEVHRSLVSQGTSGLAQRLHDHAGVARSSDRHGSRRASPRLDGLATAL